MFPSDINLQFLPLPSYNYYRYGCSCCSCDSHSWTFCHNCKLVGICEFAIKVFLTLTQWIIDPVLVLSLKCSLYRQQFSYFSWLRLPPALRGSKRVDSFYQILSCRANGTKQNQASLCHSVVKQRCDIKTTCY